MHAVTSAAQTPADTAHELEAQALPALAAYL
jgi:hypothetical protein